MHTTRRPRIECGLLAGRAVTDPAEQQRRLGRAYRLILSYDPQKKAAARGEVGDAVPLTENAQSAAG